MSTLSESLLATSIEERWKTAISGIVRTIVAALLVRVHRPLEYRAIVRAGVSEILLLTFLSTLCSVATACLRLTEYFRFRQLFSYLQEE